MKKINALSLVFVIGSIALLSWTRVVVAGLNGAFASNQNSWSSDNPRLESVTKADGNYNIALTFSNVEYDERLDNIVINPNSEESVTGLTAFLNGTAVNATCPISCSLQKGDSLQVNLVFPCSNFASGTTINIVVMGDCFGCGGSVVLP